MPLGCEVFYEFRLLFLDPVDANAPPTKEVSVVFSENEDINPDPHVATFGFPVGQPLSPGRTAAFDAFKIYQRMKWRVRTAIGGPVTSPWSGAITQTRGRRDSIAEKGVRTLYRRARRRLAGALGTSTSRAIITSVDLMIASASSPRWSLSSASASLVMTAVSV